MSNHFHLGLLACATLLVAGCGDNNDPVISAPAITITAITPTSASISWGKATDGNSQDSALVYKVYLSGANPAYQSFDTRGEVEAGTLTQTLTNVSSATISTGIVAGNAYYINVVVEDEEGNKASYEPLGEYFHTNQLSYYPFNGNTNDVETTAPNNLRVEPAGLTTSPALTSDRLSHAGSAYNFVLTTPLQCLQSANVVGIPASANQSVSFWVQSSNAPTTTRRAAFAWGNESGNGTSFGFLEDVPANNWAVWLGTTAPVSTPTTTVTSNWEHWVITSTSSNVSTYKNGVVVSNGVAATVSAVNTQLYVGCGMLASNLLGNPYKGSIDEVRIFGQVLTPADAANLYAVTRP